MLPSTTIGLFCKMVGGVERSWMVITRVFFVRGLALNPGESPSAVIVQLGANNTQFFDVPAEDVRAVPNFEFMQVVVRLPNSLPPGTCTVTIRAHSRTSNPGTIRIAP